VALPQVIFEVDFTATAAGAVFTVGDPTLGRVGLTAVGSSDVWTDVTTSVRSWSVKRGAGRGDDPTLRYDAGVASIELNDGDRRFDPENLSGPYVSAGVTQVEPMRRVRIRSAWAGTVTRSSRGTPTTGCRTTRATRGRTRPCPPPTPASCSTASTAPPSPRSAPVRTQAPG
jgi:hypothetical protein